MRLRAVFGALALAAMAAGPAAAQNPKYVNKLAPFVSSPVHIVERMLEVAHLKAGEKLYDLGSGDGRIVIAAAEKYKAKAVGVEISPKLVAKANESIQKDGLSDQARVVQGDVLETDVSDADVVTMYLGPSLNEKLRPRLERLLHAGARVVTHDYAVKGWKPTLIDRAEGRSTHLIYLYEMPPAKN